MNKQDNIRDLITIQNDSGQEQSFEVEALFDMQGETYALLRSENEENETILMQVEEDEYGQHLIGLKDQEDKQALLDAYQIAVNAAPADGEISKGEM